MTRPDRVLRSRRVVLPEGVGPATITVADGRIREILPHDERPSDAPLVDLGDQVLMPGLVDTHVHVNEPGRTEWEGFESATRAAAAGGVTTLVEMPLNSIPATVRAEDLAAKVAAATGRCRVDVGFWGGVIPGNQAELPALFEAGALGFKCFLAPSGVDEFPHVAEADLRAAMPVLTRLGAPLLVHAELPGPLERAAAGVAGLDPRRYASYLRSRPPAAETEAIDLLIRLCREHGTRVHVVHLSTADALPALDAARREGLPITVETGPHYLHFTAEEIPAGATELKCAPPIREAENRERLWEALERGAIALIASDHSPCPPAMKAQGTGDFFAAWGGIASLQLGLPVVWTEARRRGHGPERVAEWMCRAPARLAGLGGRKGAIAPGHDADLVVWRPEAELTVDPRELHHRHPLSPYAGAVLSGVVEATYLAGLPVFERGTFAPKPTGRILLRGRA